MAKLFQSQSDFRIRNKLQYNLGYQFRNIFLLHEALTHSFDKPWGEFSESTISYRKVTSTRLRILGVTVLKMVAADYAFRADSSKPPTEGSLTSLAQVIMSTENLREIGKRLSLKSFIEYDNGNWQNLMFSPESRYADFVHAVCAAVYIDAGGLSEGLSSVISVVSKLCNLRGEENTRWILMPPPPEEDVVRTLLLYGRKEYEIHMLHPLEARLEYEFKHFHLLEQALTHDSVNQYKSLRWGRNYEILEFLGDAVMDLVVTECLFWHHLHDEKGNVFNKSLVEQFVSQDFQSKIATSLDLHQYIRKPESVKVKDVHDFVESIIGGVYVDGGLSTARTVILRLLRVTCDAHWETCNNGSLTKVLERNSVYKTYEDDHHLQSEDETKFRIANVSQFISSWKCISLSEADHRKKLSDAITQEKKERCLDKLTIAEYNSLVFERLTVYRVAARAIGKRPLDLPSENKDNAVPESRPRLGRHRMSYETTGGGGEGFSEAFLRKSRKTVKTWADYESTEPMTLNESFEVAGNKVMSAVEVLGAVIVLLVGIFVVGKAISFYAWIKSDN